jgi:acetoin utilization protein AcuB
VRGTSLPIAHGLRRVSDGRKRCGRLADFAGRIARPPTARRVHRKTVMLMPTLARYMTPQPWTIRRDARMSQALQMMREHRIRHLPVLEAGKIVGIVSERDLHLVEMLLGANPDRLTVEEAMVQDVYSVRADDPVDTVVETMSQHKYGSAVVLDRRGDVEGIFTTVDALQAFAEVLRRETA